MTMTAKLAQTYQFIKHYYMTHGYAPTSTEVAAGIGISSRGVAHRYISELRDQGYLEIVAGKHRGIKLIDNNDPLASYNLPLLGEIAAGHPIEAIANEQSLNIASCLIGDNRFLLRAKGDSMIGDGIHDGDYIICESKQHADDGEIIVALIDQNEATLKRLKNNQDSTVSLLPSNPALPVMTFAAERVTIQGTYVGLLRMR